MQFTTVRSKEKDYYIYLKSEKLVHSNQEHEKNACQLFGSGKKLLGARKKIITSIPTSMKKFCQLFGSGKKWFLAISSQTNTVAAIWREKKVDPCYLETKKCSSQLLRARKKIMTSL